MAVSIGSSSSMASSVTEILRIYFWFLNILLKLMMNMLSKIRESYSAKVFDSASSKTSAKVLDMIAISMFMKTTDTRKVDSKYIDIIEFGSIPFS